MECLEESNSSRGKKRHDPSWGVWGSTLPSDISKYDALSIVIDNLHELVEYAEVQDIILGLEQHGELPGTINEVKRVLNEIDSPHLRALPNVGSFYKSGEDPVEAIEELGKKIIGVHLKDIKKFSNSVYGSCQPLGSGEINFPACIAKLREVGYNGYLTLEVEGEGGDPTFGVNVKRSAYYINEILEELLRKN